MIDQIIKIITSDLIEPKMFVGEPIGYMYDIRCNLDKLISLLAQHLDYPQPAESTAYNEFDLAVYLSKSENRFARRAYWHAHAGAGKFALVYNEYINFLAKINYFRNIDDTQGEEFKKSLEYLFYLSLALRLAFHSPMGYFLSARHEIERKENWDLGTYYYHKAILLHEAIYDKELLLDRIISEVLRYTREQGVNDINREMTIKWIEDVQYYFTIYKHSGRRFTDNITWKDILNIVDKYRREQKYTPWYSAYKSEEYEKLREYVAEQLEPRTGLGITEDLIERTLVHHRIHQKTGELLYREIRPSDPATVGELVSSVEIMNHIRNWEYDHKKVTFMDTI